jgi:hypothetical protein
MSPIENLSFRKSDSSRNYEIPKPETESLMEAASDLPFTEELSGNCPTLLLARKYRIHSTPLSHFTCLSLQMNAVKIAPGIFATVGVDDGGYG